jgi:outer membrane lipoprotein-sorting protein
MNKLLALLLIVFNTNLLAQDQLAKNVLDRLSATTQSYKNMRVSFDFIFENKNQKINEKQKGILVLQDNMFRLEMDEQIIINNGENQWIYLTDMNEVQIMEHDPEEQLMSPKKLFTIYEQEGYKYSYVGAKSVKGKRLQIIDLFPEKSGAFMKVILEVDDAKNQLQKITILDKNGGRYTYLVTSFKSNTFVESFTFNSINYPGIEVIDLR